ncbi:MULTISPECIES: carbohydrate-binding domain-containing protein [unclassified Parvimonas]|uniref:carbohydrate-binding domain-containing protein n=1 Tax=unclassified Parvimonas TaxID=1151464 RepID=UPI0039E64A64
MKANKLVVELFSLAILSGCLISCSKTTKEANTQSMQNMKINKTNSNAKSNIFSDDDYDAMVDENNSTVLNLSDISNIKGKNISVSGNVVTISSGGTYILTGKLDEGQIVVNAKSDDKVRLVFKGVEISSSKGNLILVENAKKTIITLASDSNNKLELKGNFSKDDNKDSVIFSKSDLSFNGTGILNLLSPYGRGIVSQDKVVFVDGKYTMDTAGNTISAKNSVAIADGKYDIKAGEKGTGLKVRGNEKKGTVFIANGKLDISAGKDGINSNSNVTINNGKINIKSEENGIESENIDIRGGNTRVVSKDDGIITSSEKNTEMDSLFIRIVGGKVSIHSKNNGLNSKGDISISGGETFVESSNNDDKSAINYGGSAKITGGTFIATGNGSTTKTFGDSSTQGSILMSFSKKTKENLKVLDENGKTLAEYKPKSEYKSVIVSTKDIKEYKKYKLVAGEQTLDLLLDKINYKSAELVEK